MIDVTYSCCYVIPHWVVWTTIALGFAVGIVVALLINDN